MLVKEVGTEFENLSVRPFLDWCQNNACKTVKDLSHYLLDPYCKVNLKVESKMPMDFLAALERRVIKIDETIRFNGWKLSDISRPGRIKGDKVQRLDDSGSDHVVLIFAILNC